MKLWRRFIWWIKKKLGTKITHPDYDGDLSKGFQLRHYHGIPIILNNDIPENEIHVYDTVKDAVLLDMKYAHVIKGGKLKWEKQEPKNGRKTN